MFTSLLVSLRAHLPAFDAVTTPLYISALCNRMKSDRPRFRARSPTRQALLRTRKWFVSEPGSWF